MYICIYRERDVYDTIGSRGHQYTILTAKRQARNSQKQVRCTVTNKNRFKSGYTMYKNEHHCSKS